MNKVLWGVVAGAAAGTLLGILFAPEKGSVTRKKISKKGIDYAEDLKDKFNEILDSVTEQIETIRDNTIDLVEKGKCGIDDVKKEVKNSMN